MIPKNLIAIAEKAYRASIDGWAMKGALEAYEAAKASLESQQPHPQGIGGGPLPFWKNASEQPDRVTVLKSDLVKLVRGAIYNTWHERGIADVDMVACIAVGALESYLQRGVTYGQ